MKAGVLTQHAIERYMQRTGSKKIERVIRKLFNILDRSIRLDDEHFYFRGWIIVVSKGEIKTVYKPKYPDEFRKIHDAINATSGRPL